MDITFQSFAPHPFFMQVRNDQSYEFKGLEDLQIKKINGRSSLACQKVCMPPGIANRVSRLPLNLQTKHLFYQERPTSFRLPIVYSANKTFGCLSVNRRLHSHNFDEGILFQSNPIFQMDGSVRLVIYPLAETYPIPEVFLPKQTRVHAPWVSVMSSESLALIRWTDWRLMRHSLREKTI